MCTFFSDGASVCALWLFIHSHSLVRLEFDGLKTNCLLQVKWTWDKEARGGREGAEGYFIAVWREHQSHYRLKLIANVQNLRASGKQLCLFLHDEWEGESDCVRVSLSLPFRDKVKSSNKLTMRRECERSRGEERRWSEERHWDISHFKGKTLSACLLFRVKLINQATARAERERETESGEGGDSGDSGEGEKRRKREAKPSHILELSLEFDEDRNNC